MIAAGLCLVPTSASDTLRLRLAFTGGVGLSRRTLAAICLECRWAQFWRPQPCGCGNLATSDSRPVTAGRARRRRSRPRPRLRRHGPATRRAASPDSRTGPSGRSPGTRRAWPGRESRTEQAPQQSWSDQHSQAEHEGDDEVGEEQPADRRTCREVVLVEVEVDGARRYHQPCGRDPEGSDREPAHRRIGRARVRRRKVGLPGLCSCVDRRPLGQACHDETPFGRRVAPGSAQLPGRTNVRPVTVRGSSHRLLEIASSAQGRRSPVNPRPPAARRSLGVTS
jgi:hypothetical protein